MTKKEIIREFESYCRDEIIKKVVPIDDAITFQNETIIYDEARFLATGWLESKNRNFVLIYGFRNILNLAINRTRKNHSISPSKRHKSVYASILSEHERTRQK